MYYFYYFSITWRNTIQYGAATGHQDQANGLFFPARADSGSGNSDSQRCDPSCLPLSLGGSTKDVQHSPGRRCPAAPVSHGAAFPRRARHFFNQNGSNQLQGRDVFNEYSAIGRGCTSASNRPIPSRLRTHHSLTVIFLSGFPTNPALPTKPLRCSSALFSLIRLFSSLPFGGTAGRFDVLYPAKNLPKQCYICFTISWNTVKPFFVLITFI